jgi:hypothetical protein
VIRDNVVQRLGVASIIWCGTRHEP